METIRNNSKIFIIGTIASLFEGSMYTFVFLWTPLLQAADRKDLPFGVIFAVLMLSCMCGSQIFGYLIKRMTPAVLAQRMYIVSALSLLIPVFSSSKVVMMVSFCIFEVCVGIYWPCVGTLKGIYVPENQRSAIYNLFRIPLNAIVLFVLLSKVESQTSFLCCGILLLIGAYLCVKLDGLIKVTSTTAEENMEEGVALTAPEKDVSDVTV
jgi:MFS family permease